MFPPPASPFPRSPQHQHAKSTPAKESGSLLATWLSSSAETRGGSLAMSPSHLHSSGTVHFKPLIQRLTTKRRSLQWDQLCECKLRWDRFRSADSHGAVRIKHPHNLCLCVEKNTHKRQKSKLWSSLEFIVNMSPLLFQSFLHILSFFSSHMRVRTGDRLNQTLINLLMICDQIAVHSVLYSASLGYASQEIDSASSQTLFPSFCAFECKSCH